MSVILTEMHLQSNSIILFQNNRRNVMEDFVVNSDIVFSKSIVSRDFH